MKIGYLHLGQPEHGLHRYGCLLAAEAKRSENLSVLEAQAQLGTNWLNNLKTLWQTARALTDADIVHIQYNQAIWGNNFSVINLIIFMVGCQAPLAVTLHDVYWQQHPFKLRNIATFLKAMYGFKASALRLLIDRASLLFVCTKEEKKRLLSIDSIRKKVDKKILIIPHFVEARSLLIDRHQARTLLNIKEDVVVTLLGWIHRRKGHEILVEAMANLPENVRVIFAGKCSPGSEAFLESLFALAKSLGVADRLQVTGYLTEDNLNLYLAATDIAVCPFKTCSASGSLSTWISAQNPNIIAYDLPQIEEYNHLVPESINTFDLYTGEALSKAIFELISRQQVSIDRVSELKEKLSLNSAFNNHKDQFNELLRGRLK
ncbi:glycosyltransferase [Nodosilinea sp. AN01ver1]|uniref:glycosyltransferase n=1 Tax=Nodosilinea sp. AN01ver1 TaxID=3423362 RepID=UPI003D323FB0